MAQRTGSGKTASVKSTVKGKLLLGLSLVVVFAGLLLAYYVISSPGQSPTPDSTTANQSQAPQPSSISASAPGTDQKNPGDGAPENATTQADSGPSVKEAELEHLGDVFLNSVYPLVQQDFQLNREVRAAIDVFVASMPEDLNAEALDEISAMIETQLRTPEAEELSFIITHLYRLEQEEARLMSEGDRVTTMEGQLKAQERLSQLRDEWFGPELSEALFDGADEAEASPDPPESRTEEQAELADIETAWDRRYQKFLAEKQVIDRAGLDQTEKDRQIEDLLQQHYETPEEIEAARAYGELEQ